MTPDQLPAFPAVGHRNTRGTGQPLPHIVWIDGRVGGDHRQDQAHERDQRGAELYRGEVDQLGVGDEHAEQEDLHHRPGVQLVEKAVQGVGAG
jgi:hypothetical protein